MTNGGKIAIDNINIYEGSAGLWRRDFKNGFVLVNPINKSYTFSADELAGEFSRTGIKHVMGTQMPEVNNGQPVINTLALQPLDAIILKKNQWSRVFRIFNKVSLVYQKQCISNKIYTVTP